MPSLQLDPATLTKKIQVTVAETVASTMREILMDQEYFCELQPWVQKRLAKKPQKTISLREVKRRLKARTA
ncbi:hypothetical protein HY623_00870 [Candidatus Uhrbacteria bacterium]|nr:hypothetical protein [Candidatus Uhrbacteria bacterium]